VRPGHVFSFRLRLIMPNIFREEFFRKREIITGNESFDKSYQFIK
jgi:hypothetical protein